MAVSPSWVSGISACQCCHFGNCLSLDKHWIFQVGQVTFKYGQALKSETTKTPSTLQACSFLSNPFLEFCLSTPAVSSIIFKACSTCLSKHLTHLKFQSIALEPVIIWKRVWKRNFTLVISTRSLDSSPPQSTQMVQEKVQAVPFTGKFSYSPCLSRSLFGFPV